MTPTYSICMCNYNMADTIERSLTSILDQLNGDFEVVIVDDGSSDNSLEILNNLTKKYKNIKIVPMKRDGKRKLGLSRNKSIEEAKGEYVLLHLDCDDIYSPFIIDFTKVFHQIEKAVGKDILLSGQHINMGKRSFLMEHGPYRNIFRGEDKDLWIRLSSIDAQIPFKHVNFVKRISKTIKRKIVRELVNNWDHLTNDFRKGLSFKNFVYYELKRWGIGAEREFTIKHLILRAVMFIPTYIRSKFMEPLTLPDNMRSPDDVIAYRKRMGGSFPEIMKKNNANPDYSVLSEAAKEIFK